MVNVKVMLKTKNYFASSKIWFTFVSNKKNKQ